MSTDRRTLLPPLGVLYSMSLGPRETTMDYDAEKIDEAALAMLYLTLHDTRMVWKSMDWEVTARLFAKGLIWDPVNKHKQMTLTDEGLQAAEEASRRLFSRHL